MKKSLLLIFLGLIFCQFIFSEETDSLRQVLKIVEGRERAELLIELAKSSGRSKDESNQRILYAEEVIDLFEEHSDSLLLADAYYQIGEANYYMFKFPDAIEAYEKAVNIYFINNDSVNLGDSYNSIGLCYSESDDFERAINELHKSISVFESLERADETANAYHNLANIYVNIGDYKTAINFYLKASKLNLSIQNDDGVAINYNGLGTTFFFQEKYDSSKIYYELARDVFVKLDERRSVAITLNNIANVYVNQGDSMDVALRYYQDAIAVFREIDDVVSEAYVMEGLGGIYREMGQYQKSITAFKECIEFAKRNDAGYNILKLAYDDLADTYEKSGDIKNAYEAFKLYNQYSDSLLNEDRVNQIAELQERFETERKEAEIERLNAVEEVHLLKLERDKQIRFFGIILIVLLVASILSISIAYLNKKKSNQLLSVKNVQIELQRKELEKLNASKNKFFSIMAHDLKNPFHTVMGYSYLMHKNYNQFKDEEREKYAADIYKSTNSIFRLLQNLLDWSRSQTGRLSYNPQAFDFSDLFDKVVDLIKPAAEAKNIKIQHSIDQESTVYADPMMVETIIRNLLSNAVKFSYADSSVRLVASRNENKLLICVEDNGVGISKNDLYNLFLIDSKVKNKGTNEEDGSGLGLILCKEFVEKNKGTISAESEQGKGSKFCVTLPLYKEKG